MTNILNNKDKDDGELEDLESKPFAYYKQTITRHIHHYYMSQLVEEQDKYTELLFRLQTATPDEIVHIHLNTPGGNLETGIQLINSMQISMAHVICSIEGYVASLGPMIFLAADEFVVHDNCLVMIHNYTGGVFGKGHEQIAALEAVTKWTEGISKRLFVPFISEEEYERVKNGEDLYFQSDEIRRRITKMVKTLEKQRKEEAEALEKKKTRRTKKVEATDNS